MAANAIRKQAIRFPNDNEAVAVFPSPDDKAQEIVAALGLKPYQAVILILGGAASIDEKLIPRLTQLFGLGIARAAAEADAIIIDGGTKTGVMAMMGEGVEGRGRKSMLVGVAPASKVSLPGDSATGIPLEPHHSHFVLVEGSYWGSETATMYRLAGALISKAMAAPVTREARQQVSAGAAADKVPALAILVGGGPTSRDEVLRAIRQNLPLIVVEGSGGLADEIAAAWKQRETLPDDPVMAEIVDEGEIHLHLLSNSVKGIERLILREFGVDKVLMQAWEVFADYNLNAIIQRRRFDWLQLSILILGVAGTAVAISKQIIYPKDPPVRSLNWWIFYLVLILVPILLTILITAANRFKQGSKWLLLRAGAESIKREIYRYRARAMNYKENPEQQLAQRLEDITRRTMRTEVNLSSLVPYQKEKGFPPYMDAAKGGDNGFSYLTPDRYVEVRLGDQLNFFADRARRQEKQLRALYWLTFIIGGIGTFLAAINQQVWIALTTAIVAAIGTYLGYRQTETTLTKYNQAATDLANVRAWWNALSADEQSLKENIDSLVEHTEQVLQSELDGWVQQMQNALAELRKGQEPAREREEQKEPRVPASHDGTKTPQGQTDGEQANVDKGKEAERPAGTGGAQQPSGEGGGGEEEDQPTQEESTETAGNVDDESGADQEDGNAGGDAGTTQK